MRPSVMILLCAYNEEEHVGRVVRGAAEWGFPVVVVDDGSTDGTARAAEESGAVVISHGENRGKGAALDTGFSYAREKGFEAVLTMDADGQHDPRFIGRFVDAYVSTGADVILGTRMMGMPEGMPWIRRFTNRFTSFVVSRITGLRVTDSQCGYRLIRTSLWCKVRPSGNRFDAESEILLAAVEVPFSLVEVVVPSVYDQEGDSKIDPFVDSRRFLIAAFRAWLGRKRGLDGRR